MSVWHIDFETYSACDIKVGAYRYAADPTTKILFCAIAKDDAPPELWDSKDKGKKDPYCRALDLIGQMLHDDGLIYAHNAQFEIAVCRYLFPSTFEVMAPALSRWRCTAAMCRRAAIPWSLSQAGEFLGLTDTKMTVGKRLIGVFSLPKGEATIKRGWLTIDKKKMTIEEAWTLFGEYCVRDVEVEREVHRRLSAFELKGTTLKAFQYDIRMNERGIPVNVEALNRAYDVVQKFSKEVEKEFRKLTGLNISQTSAVLDFFKIHWGYPEHDLQAATIDAFLDTPPSTLITEPLLRKALELRKAHSYAAVKKIPAMLAAAHDGRVRGAFMWSGAIRTHRWAGRIIQPQNFKRPKFKDTAAAYAMIKAGCTHEDLSLMWGEPLEVIASSIRHFIQEPGHDIIDADFASIEARTAAWLAGQDDMVDEFRRNEGLYENMAAAIFDVDPNKVTGDQRFVGKTAALGCQFGMSWRKFQSSCEGYGRKLNDKICQLAVFKYRKKRDRIVQAWKDFQNSAVVAINKPGETQHINDKIELTYGRIGGFSALTMRLPSGHLLVYPHPRIAVVEIETDAVEEVMGELVLVPKKFKTEQITFWGQLPLSSRWGNTSTHGGKLFENAVQAIAGDFMTQALLNVEEAGFEPFATIHDQALAPFHRGRGGVVGDADTIHRFVNAFTTVPKWAADFPLAASVKVTPFYQKD